MQTGPYFHRDPTAAPNSPPLLVFIEEKAVKNEKESVNGPAVYDSVLFFKVVAPGQKNGSPIYEIRRAFADGTVKFQEREKHRFAAVYEQWEKKQQPTVTGTPLEQWPLMDVALVAAFKDANVYTVQQLAELPDGMLENVRAKGREWRSKAQAWLQEARDGADVVEMQARLDKQAEEIKELRDLLSEQVSKQNGGGGFDKPKTRKKRAQQDGDDILVEMPDDAEQSDLGPRI